MLHLVLAATTLLAAQDAPDLSGLFAQPSGPMTIHLSDGGKPDSYAALVNQYARLTGQRILFNEEVKALLAVPLPLHEALTVPEAEVQMTFECLLAAQHFVLIPTKQNGTRMVSLTSLRTSEAPIVKMQATYLEPDQLHLAELHPAMIFTTTVAMPNTTTRFVCNALRMMLTDANVQELAPTGDAGAVVVRDTGPGIARWGRLLAHVEAAAAEGAVKMNRSLRVVRLENRGPEGVAKLLTASFLVSPEAPEHERMTFHADATSNSVLVSAPTHRLPEIERVIGALDAKF